MTGWIHGCGLKSIGMNILLNPRHVNDRHVGTLELILSESFATCTFNAAGPALIAPSAIAVFHPFWSLSPGVVECAYLRLKRSFPYLPITAMRLVYGHFL